ncbi:hypothetical protein CYMTET_21314, partial [Cymbomonas tetramitiformis]
EGAAVRAAVHEVELVVGEACTLRSAFRGCGAQWYGGVAYAKGSADITITTSNMLSNTVEFSGGVAAVGANSDSDIIITGSNVEYNSASDCGGVASISESPNGSIIMINNNIAGNSVPSESYYAKGGGVACAYHSGNIMTGCNMTRNTIAAGGGAVARAFWSRDVTITSSNVLNNTASSGSGGVVSMEDSWNVTISGSNVMYNYADGYGSVVDSASSGCITIIGSHAEQNKGVGVARGYDILDITITDTTAVRNSAEKYYGPVVYIDYSPNGHVNLTDIVMSHNTAFNGGAVYARAAGISMHRCSIKRNEAIDSGGVAYVDSTPVTITDCDISQNSAGDGGVVYLRADEQYDGSGYDGSITITSSNITQNSAQVLGGVMYVENGGNITIAGSDISHNIASEHGGVAYLTVYGNLIITDCNVAHNEAGGDGGVAYSEQNENIIITRSDMTSNTAGVQQSEKQGFLCLSHGIANRHTA